MSDYQFDDTPLPTPTSRRGHRSHPMWTIPVGKSFFVAGKKAVSLAAYGRVVAKTFVDEGREKPMFVVEERTEDGVEGTRIWRKA